MSATEPTYWLRRAVARALQDANCCEHLAEGSSYFAVLPLATGHALCLDCFADFERLADCDRCNSTPAARLVMRVGCGVGVAVDLCARCLRLERAA